MEGSSTIRSATDPQDPGRWQAPRLSDRTFHGKILLFGEYSVIEGSDALVYPYLQVSGQLDVYRDQGSEAEAAASNQVMQGLAGFLANNSEGGALELDTKRLLTDVENGLFFRSTIPLKYGLGSSGALCAAVYDSYRISHGSENKETVTPEFLQDLRRNLATIESYFHGSSSGIDPLCIYMDRPVLIRDNRLSLYHTGRNDANPLDCFLIDTGMPGKTSDLIDLFRQQMKDQDLAESFSRQYIPLVNDMIRQFTLGALEFEMALQLSVFQRRLFGSMIPAAFEEIWQFGIDKEYYALKLCGSGGGGMLLGFTTNLEVTGRVFTERYNIPVIPLRFNRV